MYLVKNEENPCVAYIQPITPFMALPKTEKPKFSLSVNRKKNHTHIALRHPILHQINLRLWEHDCCYGSVALFIVF